MQNLLEVKGLKVYHRTATRPVKAVDGVSLKLKKGEVLGIAGESGCGKSTLANAIATLVEPPTYVAGGKILFQGLNLLELGEEELNKIRWKKISILPQSAMNALNPVMKIYDQIKDAIKFHEPKLVKDEDRLREHIYDLLKRVALPSYTAKAYPCQLSGGMRQRAILAMAVALNPELLIVDEPTSALDVVTQRKILELLMDLRDEMNLSIIFITHDIAVLAEIADRVGVMYAGKIVETRSVFEIFKNPLHPYTQVLISATPSLKSRNLPKGLPGLPPDLRSPPRGCRLHPRCPYATDLCRREEPTLVEIGPDEYVACHIYEKR